MVDKTLCYMLLCVCYVETWYATIGAYQVNFTPLTLSLKSNLCRLKTKRTSRSQYSSPSPYRKYKYRLSNQNVSFFHTGEATFYTYMEQQVTDLQLRIFQSVYFEIVKKKCKGYALNGRKYPPLNREI
jgi:hypothetical protein